MMMMEGPPRRVTGAPRPGRRPARRCAGAALVALTALSGCGPALLVGSGAAVATSVVQERSTMAALSDAETALSIETRLAQHSGELYRDVSVDVVEGRVLLTGSVPRREDRIEAERIAWTAVGVDALTNEITVAGDSGIRAYWRDVRISTAVRSALVLDGRVAARNVNVATVDGVVHLTGLARSSTELERMVSLARGTEGVARVVSHVLLIDDPRRRTGIRRAAADTTALR